MDDIPIVFTSQADCDVSCYPVTFGIPIAKAQIQNAESVRLFDENGRALVCALIPLAYWNDGSIRWMRLDCQLDLLAGQQRQLTLKMDDRALEDQARQINVQKNALGHGLVIDTGGAEFKLSSPNREGRLFDSITLDDIEQLSDEGIKVELVGAAGNPMLCQVLSVDLDERESNPLVHTVQIRGQFTSGRKEVLEFNLKLYFYANKPYLKGDFCLLNPRAAVHQKGIWDLGDPHSSYFQSLVLHTSLNLKYGEFTSSLKPEAVKEWVFGSKNELRVYQDSSGGDQWNCNNHLNYQGKVMTRFKGYKIFDGADVVEQGERANPQIRLKNETIAMTAGITDFWQNFPSELKVTANKIQHSLFPSSFADDYELQAGEQKTQSFYLGFGPEAEPFSGLGQPVICHLSKAYYAACGVFLGVGYDQEQGSEIQQLIAQGLDGENNFFAKREVIDEYGWRNYGDIYADHEQLEYKGKDLLISHYNNQYDPLQGFILQYVKTSDTRWLSLAEPLARHIVDIDIYHTNQDRDEYNGGLFWHTDHYLNAYTCTHRTFSARHAEDYLYGEIGGGPGTEHCYTTGLASYFFLTGHFIYKEAALGLTQWVGRSFSGSGTLIERVFKFKSRDIPILKRLFKQEKIQQYDFPFTRGTGNYLTALVDSFNLTGEEQYLSKAEDVIRRTIHPAEDITLRNLDDVENTWSYLIFLQAVGKYLEIKVKNDQVDQAASYARECLILYADWIAENEKPFLEHPDRLEFPNATWTAQDLRKAALLKVAARFCAEKSEYYLQRAKYFEDYVVERLHLEPTLSYARILIILMQNDMELSGTADKKLFDLSHKSENLLNHGKAPMHSVPKVFWSLMRDVFISLKNFSISKEKAWLKFRMK